MVCQHLNPHKLAAGNCTESLHLKWINLSHLSNGSLLSTPPWLKFSYSCSENYHLAKQYVFKLLFSYCLRCFS